MIALSRDNIVFVNDDDLELLYQKRGVTFLRVDDIDFWQTRNLDMEKCTFFCTNNLLNCFTYNNVKFCF